MRSEVRRRHQRPGASPSIWKSLRVRASLLVSATLLVLLAPVAGAGVDVVRENLCEFLPQEVGGAEIGQEQRRDFTDCVAAYQLGTPSSDGQTPVHLFDVWIASPQWGDVDGLLADDYSQVAGGPIDIGDEGLAGVDAAETGPVEEYVVAFRRADLYVHVKTFLGPYEGRPALSAADLGARSEALARAIDGRIVAALGDEPESGANVPPPPRGDDPATGGPSTDATQGADASQPFDEDDGGVSTTVIVGVVVVAAIGIAVAKGVFVGTSGPASPPPPPPPPEPRVPPPGPGGRPRAPGDKAEPEVHDLLDDGWDVEDTEGGLGTTG